MTKTQLDEYTEKLAVRGSVYGTECMRALMEELGNIQDTLRYVHIAGTNGKGSTITIIAAVLKAAGYNVGQYTSPAVIDKNEIYKFNGRNISNKDLVETVETVKEAADRLEAKGTYAPTLFEVQTAAAFVWFARKKCDIVVLETGLGGRDDATNIISNPLVTVFASISRDHMGILGDTVEQIASVKCGIIKKGCHVVSTRQLQEVRGVIDDCAVRINPNIPPVYIGEATKIRYGLNHQTFSYKGMDKLWIGLSGTWQIENACTAIEAVYALKDKGFVIEEKHIRKGLKDAVWDGRFTTISKKPLIIIDGAHNEDAARRLRQSVDIYLEGYELVYVIGVLADKEYEKVVASLIDRAGQVVTVTPPNNKRALSAIELAEVVSRYNPNVTSADSVEEGLEIATLLERKMADNHKKTGILVFGSLSYLGVLRRYVKEKEELWKSIRV